MATTRRRFLEQAGAAAAGGALWPATSRASINSSPNIHFPSHARDRIAVASYPFRAFIFNPAHKGLNSPAGKFELKDFAAHASEKFNIKKIEPWTGHFPSTDPKYLEQFRTELERTGGAVVNIAVDGERSPYAADRGEREQAITFSKHWADVASAIGSPSIRTNIPPAPDSIPDADRTAESLQRVVEYASSKGIVIHLENDNPASEDPFFITKVIEKVNSPWLHALPDFGNSLAAHEEEYAYRGIDAMFAHAYGISHVKESETNDSGKTVHVDLAKTFGIAKRHGYQGYFSMEWDDTGDPYQATARMIAETVLYVS